MDSISKTTYCRFLLGQQGLWPGRRFAGLDETTAALRQMEALQLDPKLERKTGTLQILGFWLEEDAPKDKTFANALANGLKRFANLIGATKVDLSAIQPVKLRSYLKKKISL